MLSPKRSHPPVPILLLWAQHPAKLGHPKFQGVGEMGQLWGWGTCACPHPHVKIWGVENQHANFFSPFPFLSFPPRLPDPGVNGAFTGKPTPPEGPQRPASPPQPKQGLFPSLCQPQILFPCSPKSSLAFCYGRRGAHGDGARGKRAPCNLAHSPEWLRAPPLFFFFLFPGLFYSPNTTKTCRRLQGGGGQRLHPAEHHPPAGSWHPRRGPQGWGTPAPPPLCQRRLSGSAGGSPQPVPPARQGLCSGEAMKSWCLI